jgi:hypothetical protein
MSNKCFEDHEMILHFVLKNPDLEPMVPIPGVRTTLDPTM